MQSLIAAAAGAVLLAGTVCGRGAPADKAVVDKVPWFEHSPYRGPA
jgi:hypothetical protein